MTNTKDKTINELGKKKIIAVFKKYGVVRGGKEDGVFQKYDIKDWTNKKGLNMAKQLQEELSTEVQKKIEKAVNKTVENWNKDNPKLKTLKEKE